MAQHDGNKQRGWVNYFRVLAGGYLLYLAYQLMKGIWDGTAETVALNAAAGAVFAVAGAMVLWREWKAYQYAKAHKDDPDSWSQDDALRSRSVRRHLQNRSDPKRTRRDGTRNEAGRALRRRAGGALLQRAVHPPGVHQRLPDLHGAIRTTVHGGRPGDGGGP